MKKQLSEKAVYEPNSRVKVTVDNKPVYDDQDNMKGYLRKVTVVVNAGTADDKLSFSEADDIAEFMGTVDFDDPQLSLPGVKS